MKSSKTRIAFRNKSRVLMMITLPHWSLLLLSYENWERKQKRERELGFQRPYLLREKRKGSVSWWWRGKNANQASYLIISVCKKKLFSALYQLWFLLPSPRWWWFLTELTVVLTEITKVALTSSQNPIEFWMGILTAQPPDSWDLSHIFDPTRS